MLLRIAGRTQHRSRDARRPVIAPSFIAMVRKSGPESDGIGLPEITMIGIRGLR